MRRAALLVALAIHGAVAAQVGEQLTAAQDAVRAWLATEHAQEELRDRAAKALLDSGRPGLRWLGAELDRGPSLQKADRRRLESLAVATSLQFLERAAESEMVYAGQYDDLRSLQPLAGRLLLSLLLETPDWFPNDRRLLLVPALRDLYPKSPGEEDLARMRDLAEDELFESWDLRTVLSYALAQWGVTELVDRRQAELEEQVATAQGSDRLDAMRTLADLHYRKRDYRAAARAHQAFLAAAEADGGDRLIPLDLYNAACSLALAGDLVAAEARLLACFELMQSGRIDRSLLLKRRLFERDPEIQPLRGTPMFREQFAKTFPPPSEGTEAGRNKRPGRARRSGGGG